MSLMARYRKPKPEPAPTTTNSNGSGPLVLTLKQAVIYSGLPDKRLRILIRDGKIKCVDLGIKKHYIARTELDRYVASLPHFVANPTYKVRLVDGTERNRPSDRLIERSDLVTMTDNELRAFFEENEVRVFFREDED